MLIVMTTVRNGVSYLEATLAGLQGMKALRDCVILSDGPLPEIDTHGFEVIKHKKHGARATGWAAFKLAQKRDVKDAIVVQDDLVVCADAAEVMHAAPVPAELFGLMFYTAYPPPGFQYSSPGVPRILVRPAARASGGQAIKFSRASVDYLCTKDPINDAFAAGVPVGPHFYDTAVFKLAATSSTPEMGIVLPCVVEHGGHVSSVAPHPPHLPVWAVGAGKKFPADSTTLPVVRP